MSDGIYDDGRERGRRGRGFFVKNTGEQYGDVGERDPPYVGIKVSISIQKTWDVFIFR